MGFVETLELVPEHPDDSNSSSQTPGAWLHLPFYSSLPLMHERMLVISFNDVTNICSTILVGNPSTFAEELP